MLNRTRTALVTGGSRGLGAALVTALARRGVAVVAVARGETALDALVHRLREEGHDVHGITADVGDPEAAWRIAGRAAEAVGPIDLLVNNASTLGPLPMPLLLDTEDDALERVLQVNLLGPIRLARAIAGSMVVRGQGRLVHISSDAAVEPYPRWGAYGLSKAALDHWGRILRTELAETGVDVVSFDPGEMNTTMLFDAMPDADPADLADPADVADRLLHRLFGAEEVAA